MVNIDLKTSGSERSAYETKTDSGLWVVLLLTIIVIGVWVGQYFWKMGLDGKIKGIESQITAETEKFNRPDAKKVMDLQNRINIAGDFAEKENRLQIILSELEKVIIPDAYLKSINCEKDTASLVLVAKDFTALAKQIANFQKPENFFKKVSVGPAKLNSEQKVEASITLNK